MLENLSIREGDFVTPCWRHIINRVLPVLLVLAPAAVGLAFAQAPAKAESHSAQAAEQAPTTAAQVQDKMQPPPPTTTESAEHKYARQQLEPVARLRDELGKQLEAQTERMKRACSYQEEPNFGRPVFKAHEKASEKKEALASYEARRNACQKEMADTTLAEAMAVEQKFIPLEFKLNHADECAAIYRKTIDEKAADVTTREAEQINECKSADLYPPAK